MKAAEAFLQGRGKPAPSHPVKILLVHSGGVEQQVQEVEAVFRLVPDRLYAEAIEDAAASARKMKEPPTDEVRRALEQSHLLHAILRDKDAPATPFFDGPDEARALLLPDSRVELIGEYQRWKESVLPTHLTPEEFKAFEEDAKALFLPALLSKYGYWPTLWALASLARQTLGMSLTR